MSTTKYVVHATDHEGGLELDKNGIITTAHDDRPEWANGLAVANLKEHADYYTNRVGPDYTTPQIINKADLNWVGVTDDGELMEHTADAEFRNERLGLLLGIDVTDIEAFDRQTEGALAEVTIAMDNHRTAAEVTALEESQQQAMPKVATGG